jgi:ribosomal protein S18 acetylase RimI-like enzyme
MCVSYAKQNGFTKINLEVANGNIRAIQLYEKAGFCILERRDSSLLMSLELK